MKQKTVYLVILLFSICFIQAQSNSSTLELSTVIVHRENIANPYLEYSFKSKKLIVQEKIERWESRYKIMFPEIKEIDLDATEQLVTIIINKNHSQETLNKIIIRFGYQKYEIK
ncbi:MAG: hypothetical protein COA97_10520 [Flavobacteriales bacterium]|nr:MAG: hypothetical protein COA97_10520 [Flavobacteriales bacterium]